MKGQTIAHLNGISQDVSVAAGRKGLVNALPRRRSNHAIDVSPAYIGLPGPEVLQKVLEALKSYQFPMSWSAEPIRSAKPEYIHLAQYGEADRA